MKIIFYHNPKCATSKKALKLLEKEGVKPKVIEYLENPPSKAELKSIAKKIGVKPEELVRKKEKLFKNMYKGVKLTDGQWLDVLVKNPILIERPIAVAGKKAVLGRPPTKVLELLK
jgi:arsenate reductase